MVERNRNLKIGSDLGVSLNLREGLDTVEGASTCLQILFRAIIQELPKHVGSSKENIPKVQACLLAYMSLVEV